MATNVEKVTGFQLGNNDGMALSTETTLKPEKYNLFATKSFEPKGTEYARLNQNFKSQALFNIPIKKEVVQPKQTSPVSNVNLFAKIPQYFSNVNQKVNEYDAAVNHALKYLPKKDELDLIVKSNPRISAILAEANLPVKMNYDNLKTIKHSHISTTVQYARTIGKELGLSEDELKTMEVGAALHDIGKTLIPEEILNKNGKLTEDERKIINLHSVLGYEILKSAGFGTNVAEIARDHHNPVSKNKYAQIVRAADVYSAMREERSYKKGRSHEEAMEVLRNMKIDNKILATLEKHYGKKPQTQNINPSYATQVAIC